MTEKVLPYDRSIVPQETGYWCGPAVTQVVLNSRGIRVSEGDLAREIGTTTRGTDYIGLIERVLDRVTPDAAYTSVYLEQDPPTQAQKDRLWQHIISSIDAGYGVVMNWVAPPDNYPRGVKGSVSPRYSGGTVYHYVACMGYDADARAVWIADSGFQPQGYWISFAQCASLIPPKGYCYATTTAANLPENPESSPDATSVLSKAMGDAAGLDRYAALLPAVTQCLDECGCDTALRRAMWFAQIGHETAGLRWMEELADGSAYEGRTDLGNTQPGDGRRFKGRGAIMVTGRANYAALSKWAYAKGFIPSPTFFVDQPEQLASDRYGLVGVVWYWTVARPDINTLADAGDLEGVTRRINGGLNGISDRRARYDRCLAMGAALLTLTTGGDQLAGVNIDRLNAAVDKILSTWGSRSIYRAGDQGVDDTVGMLLNIDGSIHEMVTEHRALLFGDPDAVALIRATADGRSAGSKIDDKPNPDAIARAKRVLARIDTAAAASFPRLITGSSPPAVCALSGAACALVAQPKVGP